MSDSAAVSAAVGLPAASVPVAARGPASKASVSLDPMRSLEWRAIARGFESRREEPSYWVPAVDIEGEVPLELVGTVFRNGPGLSEVFGQRLKHPIDGDGIIAAITFLPVTDARGKKKIHFRERFVRSEHHVKEKEARKFLFRGQMGTQATSWLRDSLTTARDLLTGSLTPLQYRNPSNTNVFYWGGKLLSCYETGLPHVLDPRTLETLGLDDLGGALTHGTMAAHFRYDSRRDVLVVISLRPGLRKGSALSIMEFDKNWKMLQKQVHRIPHLAYAHDFLLTEHFYVFHITPFVKVTKELVYEIATGVSSPGEQMKYYPDLPSRMVAIPRAMEQHTQLRFWDVPPCHIFHFGTSRVNYAPGAAPSATSVQSIEFSAVCLPKGFAMFPTQHGAFLSNCDTAPAHLCYFHLDFTREGSFTDLTVLDDSSCEFPSTHPYRHGLPSRFTWVMANARGQGLPFRDVIKIDEHAALMEAEARQAKAKAASAASKKMKGSGSKSSQSSAKALLSSDPVGAVKAPQCSAPSTEQTAGACTAPPPAMTATRKIWFSHGVVGEPIFIPRQSGPPSAESSCAAPEDEDDGWLFVQCYVPEKHTTDFVILCAREPQKGPLAVIHLKHHVCYGFHGTFTPHVFFDDPVDGTTVREAAPPEMRAKL